MENFLKSVMEINDEIAIFDPTGDILQTQKVNKQYLVYYLYRILCKYQKIIGNVVSMEKIYNVYRLLNIPEGVPNCYSLRNRLTNDTKELELIYLSILDIFSKFEEDKDYLVETKYSTDFLNFLQYKENVSTIKQDLLNLSKIIPSLGEPETPPNKFE